MPTYPEDFAPELEEIGWCVGVVAGRDEDADAVIWVGGCGVGDGSDRAAAAATGGDDGSEEVVAEGDVVD